MYECLICQTEIKENQPFIKLPCCLRRVHENCQLEISCRKWRKMAKNKKFNIEKCTICSRKITTPLEKHFIGLTLAIKMAKQTVSKNDKSTALEVLGKDWKNEVYNMFGNFLKNKMAMKHIRESKKPLIDSLSEYMIVYTNDILNKQNIQATSNSEGTSIVGESDLPEDVLEKFKNLPPPNLGEK